MFLVIGVAVVVLVGWQAYQRRQENSGTIKIAALLSTSGGAAAWGENAQKAIALATEELNQKGGINGKQEEVLYKDTGSDPKQAVSTYRQATSLDHVTAVLGPLNQTETLPVLPLIERDKIPVVAPGYVPLEDRKNLRNPIFVWTDAETEAGRMAEYVFSQGIHTIGVIGTLDSWENTVSTAFAKRFKELGGTVSKQEIVQPAVTDMKLPVTEVVATHPQAVFLGTYYQFVNSTKALHDLRYTGKLYSIEDDDYLASQTYAWTAGLQFIAPDFYTSDFVNKFKQKYGTAPGLPAGQAYDAANILFSFLRQGRDPNDILEKMKSFSEYDGVSGQLKITSDGRTILPTALFQIDSKGNIIRVSSLN